MAASTLDDALFTLIDNFGPVGPNLINTPSDWTEYTTAQNWQLGATIVVPDVANGGLAILRYLKIMGGTEGAANGVAVKGICALRSASNDNYTLVPDGGEADLHGPIAVCLGTISFAETTTAYYGWFWTGGVCPVGTISGLNGNYDTDGNVTAAAGMDLVDNSGPLAFGLLASTDVGVVSAYTFSADA